MFSEISVSVLSGGGNRPSIFLVGLCISNRDLRGEDDELYKATLL